MKDKQNKKGCGRIFKILPDTTGRGIFSGKKFKWEVSCGTKKPYSYNEIYLCPLCQPKKKIINNHSQSQIRCRGVTNHYEGLVKPSESGNYSQKDKNQLKRGRTKMNTSLKIGLIFQAIQLGLIGFAGLVWVLTKINITPIAILIFMWVCINIGSLILIVNGMLQDNSKY
jgi:hypothetical protein